MPAETTATMTGGAEVDNADRRRALSAARKALADVAHEPGAPKPDPIVVADNITRTLRRPHRGRRRARRDPARRHHRR